MTTTMNQTTTTTATTTDYWTLTAQFVAIRGDESSHCEEVAALTAKWNEHRFGLCCECDCGLDDEADFVITGNANEYDTSLMCCACFAAITEGPCYGY